MTATLLTPIFAPGLRLLPGLALCAVLAACAMVLGDLPSFQAHGLGVLTLAIVLGMLVGNTVYPRWAGASGPGVHVAKQRLLRLGVVLYGLRLTTQDMASVGLAGVLVDALVLGSTFALACWVGTRWLGLDRNTAMLVGMGSAVCGAAAVMATGPVLRARAEQVTVAVATVVVFGTLATFVYPLLYAWNLQAQWVPGGAHGFGIYTGSTIHEVAQVVAAARAIGPEAADAAVIAKMVRVMMLAPVLLALSAWLAREGAHTPAQAAPQPLAIPWFAVGFVGMVLFHSLQWLPVSVVAVGNQVDTVLLAMAMAALGLSTQLGAIRRAGVRPLLLAGLLFAWLVVGGAGIQHGVAEIISAPAGINR
ncbi:YeiH family protein [Rhodoferax sp. WC2427]|uniref:YeiH family protein n=1 Tax=Rhodoferax sp. WC2427 TaxID=3234144 RepID=UPI003466BCA4